MRRILVAMLLCACPSFDDALAQCRDAGRCVVGTPTADASVTADAGSNLDAGQPDASVLDAGSVVDAGLPPTSLMVSPLQLDFGTLAVNDMSSSQPLTIRNGAATAVNLRVDLPSGFVQANTSSCTSTLRASESCVMQIAFNPNLAATFNAMGSVIADNAPLVSFQVTGIGANSSIVMRPGSLDFGLVELSAPHTRHIELKNEGSVLLSNLMIQLESDAGVFTLTNDTCGTTLNSMAVCRVHVDMSAAAAGRFEGAVIASATPGATRRAALTVQTGATLSLSIAGGLTAERVITDGLFDGGLRCDTSCQALVAHGQTRSIRLASTTARTQLASWSGACSGRGVCNVTIVGPTQVGARAVSNNFIFVTSSTYTGALGTNVNADSICMAHALDAGMPNEKYVALLAPWSVDNRGQAALPLLMPNQARGWVRPDGQPFADSQSDIEAQRTFYPPTLDEHGVRLVPQAVDGAQVLESLWSGFELAAGRLNVSNTDACQRDGNAWVDRETSARGRTGSIFNHLWFGKNETGSCADRRHLLCVGIDQTDAGLPPTAPSGARRVFLSASFSVTPIDSRAALDAMCNSEAKEAGLSSSTGFAALRAELGTAASSAFSLGGGPWYRVDNVAAFDPASELVGANGPSAPLDLNLSGAHGTQAAVWLGAPDLVTPATLETSCNGWTADAGQGLLGQAGYAAPGLAPLASDCTTDFGFPAWGGIVCLER